MIHLTKRRQVSSRTISMAIAVLLMVETGSSWVFYSQIRRDLHQQVQEEVKSENEETVSAINSRIEAKLDWLDTVAGMVGLAGSARSADSDRSADCDRWWDLLRNNDIEGAYRIGIADSQGIVYYGDNERKDVSAEPFYQAAMSGESYISSVMEKRFRGVDGIILSTPVLSQQGEAAGAVAIEYSTRELGHQINMTDLTGYGVNLIIDSNGKLIATYEGLEKYGDFYEMFQERRLKDGCSVEKMQERVRRGEPGYLEYYDGENKRMLYHHPVGINDWTAVSIVANQAYYTILERIQWKMMIFVSVTVCIITAWAYLVLQLILRKNMQIKEVNTDKLTGIYSREEGRRLVIERFKNGQSGCCGCLFLDLDNLKQINDQSGHEEGDKVLRAAGEAIRTSVRAHDIAYRFGGDEFCIWLYGNGGDRALKSVAERILKNASYLDQRLSFSIGIAPVLEGERDEQEILKRADIAMYEAKKAGKHRVKVYEETVEN